MGDRSRQTLKKEEVNFSEMLVPICETTQQHIPEDHIHNNQSYFSPLKDI
jgi:hypothetical protein